MNLNSRKDIFSFFIQYISKILDFVSNHIAANDISEKILLDFESWTRDILKENQSNIYYGVQQATANTIKNLISNLSDSYTDIEVKDFKYILSGLFDEIIIYLSNIDKEEWNKYMIERYLFNTATSGSQIIEMIKVHNQSHTMKDNEMSIIYYQILSFGYMGKYRFEKVKYR
ncbi:hypothetical protein AB837_00203 [bacterium AB1]|nr:hypothetical protein AB837_00203 [bacterium AB1]